LLTSKKYYLDHNSLTLHNWEEAKNGLIHNLRKEITEVNSPWILRPAIRITKKFTAWLNKIIGFRKGLIDFYCYEKLFNSHIALFGQSDHQQRYLECQLHLIELRIQRIQTGDVFIENYIDIAEKKLLELKKMVGITTDQMLLVLAKFQGGGVIHKRDIMVVEYENLIILYGRATNRQE